MGLLKSNLSTDQSKETDGVPVEIYLPSGDEIKLTLAFAGGTNRQYKNLLSAKTKKIQRKLMKGNVSEDQILPILIEVLSKTVVKGWDDGQFDYDDINDDGDSTPLDFSEENCIKLLTKYPILVDLIQQEASDISNFLAEQREEDVKKS